MTPPPNNEGKEGGKSQSDPSSQRGKTDPFGALGDDDGWMPKVYPGERAIYGLLEKLEKFFGKK